MNSHDTLVDPKSLQHLVKEIGIEDTRRFMDSLDEDFQQRIASIRDHISARSFAGLAAEAHALKSSAQISGAFRLAEILTSLELQAKAEDDAALETAQEAITTADLTRFAFLDIKFED